MSGRKKILWLVSWYPNKYDAFDGDFIQRHAKAAAIYDDIHVLFVKVSDKQQSIEEERREENGLTEQIIYFPATKGLLGKWKNYQRWKQLHKKTIADCYKKFTPSLVHVHIPWKVGLIALWLKKKYQTPFIVTEHWGIYNNVVEDNIHTKSFFVRYFLKKIFQEAKSFVSVSRYLGESVNQALIEKSFTVIPNVVDTNLFFHTQEKNERFTFVHVSNMVPLKNVEGILQSFQGFLQQTGADAQFILIGNRDNRYELVAQELNLLNTAVFFKGEIPYASVAKEMQRANVFVLNSRLETFSCVVSEALCCGVPVIATNVGALPELINPQNGVLIPFNDPAQLTAAMVEVYENYYRFHPEQIAVDAQHKYSFLAVGKQLHQLYKQNM